MKIGILLRAGSESASLRYKVARLSQAFEPIVIALRTPPVSKTQTPAISSPLRRRVVGKVRGVYAKTNFPARYYNLPGSVEAARKRFLPDSPALATYANYQLFDVPKINSEETADIIRGAGIDVLVPSVGIVRPVLLEASPLGCLNVHHGWLPSIRGKYSAFHAIIEDRPDWLGATVHFMDEGIDTGPILCRMRPNLSVEDTHETLYVRLDVLSTEMLVQTLSRLQSGTIQTVENVKDAGVSRTRPTFLQHLKMELSERRFFQRHGKDDCPPLTLSRSICDK